jgi:hypothetical protein
MAGSLASPSVDLIVRANSKNFVENYDSHTGTYTYPFGKVLTNVKSIQFLHFVVNSDSVSQKLNPYREIHIHLPKLISVAGAHGHDDVIYMMTNKNYGELPRPLSDMKVSVKQHTLDKLVLKITNGKGYCFQFGKQDDFTLVFKIEFYS